MRPLTAISSLLSCVLGCSTSQRAEHDELEPPASPSTAADAGATAVGSPIAPVVPREARLELVRDAFIAAASSTPPPAVGSAAPLLRLRRPRRSAVDLTQRVTHVLTAMGLSSEPPQILTWARTAVDASDGLEPSIFEPTPGVVATYDATLDDLLIVDTRAIDSRTRVRADVVPWEEARHVLQVLIDGDIVDPNLSLDEAAVAFVRSGAGGPNGEDEQWVDEIRFEANLHMAGMRLVDAGIRIGITPMREVSSVRVTGIAIEPVGSVTIGTTAQALHDAFCAYIVDTAPPFESLQIALRGPVYMLDPNASSGLVDPRYLVAHSIVVRDGAVSSTSRSTITLWSMTSPEPALAARLPE